jgi:hypothetical protein
VEEAPDVVLDMLFINATFAVMLFDYTTSYSFIFAAYVKKHNMPLALLMCQMIASSLRGEMLTFPEELSGMPPDRDIEFVIDLEPNIVPM